MLFQKLPKISVHCALAKKVSATLGPPFTVSFLALCVKVVILPITTAPVVNPSMVTSSKMRTSF